MMFAVETSGMSYDKLLARKLVISELNESSNRIKHLIKNNWNMNNWIGGNHKALINLSNLN